MHALRVVMIFFEYGGYSKKETNAVKALNKKFPSLSRRKCANVFDRTLRLYEDAITFVESNVSFLFKKYRSAVKHQSRFPAEIRFTDAHRNLPVSVVTAAINWIFYWRHLR